MEEVKIMGFQEISYRRGAYVKGFISVVLFDVRADGLTFESLNINFAQCLAVRCQVGWVWSI